MREIDNKAVEASTNPHCLDRFIEEQEFFILKCASRATHRYVSKSHDAWSVALTAFSEAIRGYSYAKGSFLHFAELVIRQRLIDELRRQARYQSEIAVDPHVFSAEQEDNEGSGHGPSLALLPRADRSDESLKDEIEALTLQLKSYGFAFHDLLDCSPKTQKTREACAKAIHFIASSQLLCREMRRSKTLPLKITENISGVPRKTLERYRKYIIAGIEIMTGDYPYLAEYMRPFGEESKK